MRNIILALAAAACMACGYAQTKVDSAELSYGENLVKPAVPAKAVAPIRRHMEDIYASLEKHGMKAQLTRNGEAVVVTIPCATLFAPNQVTIKESGKKYLRPFLDFLKYPTMYKLVIAVHSDNTGEPDYLDNLTGERANAIDDFLCDESRTAGVSVVPYGIGEDEPLCENNSVENREANRRVEIYVVPEWQMIEAARAGRMK